MGIPFLSSGKRAALLKKELPGHYDSCLEHMAELTHLFYNKRALETTLDHVADSGKAALSVTTNVHRFRVPTYLISDEPDRTPDSIIIPSTTPFRYLKGAVYHETVHHVLHHYERLSGRSVAEPTAGRIAARVSEECDVEQVFKRVYMDTLEKVTDILTDYCLADDPQERAEHRYLDYVSHNPDCAFDTFFSRNSLLVASLFVGAGSLYMVTTKDFSSAMAHIAVTVGFISPIVGIGMDFVTNKRKEAHIKRELIKEKENWEFPKDFQL